MSLNSSETVSYSTSKVACVFLAQFHPKTGHKLVWSKSPANIKPEGLEYKALPSGIHEYEKTTIYLTHETQGKLYYGLARFQQLNLNSTAETDRDLVKMYSLGILLEPLAGKHWKPNEFGRIGWEHLDSMEETLSDFLKDEKMEHIEALYHKLTSEDLDLPRFPQNSPMVNHPLSSLPAVLSVVGPLIFPIYKAGLLRKKIMIFNHSSQGGELVTGPSNRSPEICGSLAYIISLLSIVPKDVNFEPLDKDAFFSQPIYTVGLLDMGSGIFEHYPGYIACTSDEILKFQQNLYDVGIIMPPSDNQVLQVANSDSLNEPLRATFNDYTKFLKVYRKLPSENNGVTSDDTSSIRTSNSVFSSLRFDIHGENINIKLSHEPSWWLDEATSPMSWREYIWLAFAWFASAGTTNRASPNGNFSGGHEQEESRESVKKLLLQLTLIVGHFHKLTKKWFFVIDEIVAEALEDKSGQPQPVKVTLELTHQDIVDMELDPYLHEDLQFVREFVQLYWGGVVEDVEIGLGIQGVCC